MSTALLVTELTAEVTGRAQKDWFPPLEILNRGFLNSAMFLAGGLPTDEDLSRIIAKGLHGSAMLPWDLEKPSIMAVVQYIKTFAPDVWEGKDKELGEVMVLQKDPYGMAHKNSALARGKEVYHLEGNCQSCHRAYVSKSEFQAMYLKANGDKIPLGDIEEDFHKIKMQESEYLFDGTERLVKTLPPEFTWHPVRSAETIPDLFLRIKSGIGGTTMPSWHEVLSDSDIWAVSHYIHSLMELREKPKERKLFMEKISSQKQDTKKK